MAQKLYCLTGNATEGENLRTGGTYTYCMAGTTKPFFPEAGPDGSFRRGQVPFEKGVLTEGQIVRIFEPGAFDFDGYFVGTDREKARHGVRWNYTWHTPGPCVEKDIVFDFRKDCRIERVLVVGEGAFRSARISVRGQGEERFSFLAESQTENPKNDGMSKLEFKGLSSWGRWVSLTVNVTFGGLNEIQIWGAPLEVVDRKTLRRGGGAPVPHGPDRARGKWKIETDYGVRDKEKVRVLPEPQKMRLTGKDFVLTKDARIILPGDADERDWETARLLADKLDDALGIRPKVVCGPAAAGDILLGGAAAALAHRVPGKEQGYVLIVGPKGVSIRGADKAGDFYGVWTLVQLAERSSGRGRIPGCEIVDWPRQRWRGIHIYMPPQAAHPWFRTFVREFLARFKLNMVIVETTASIRFDSHPEMNRAWEKLAQRGIRDPFRYPSQVHHLEVGGGKTMSKEAARGLVEWANSHFIEVVPEIQSLSHCEYLFPAHPEIAEKPEAPVPSAYCPSNPKSYEILFDISKELAEVFRPKFVHIGHDELRQERKCEKCRARRGWELFGEDVLRLHAFWRERGVRIMMWGDHLIPTGNGGEKHDFTARCFDSLPSDIIICNWTAGRAPESIAMFRRKGMEQVFLEYDNYFVRPPVLHDTWGDVDAFGLVATTWIQCDEFHVGGKGNLYGTLFLAEQAWSPAHPSPRSPGAMNKIALFYEETKGRFRGHPLPSETPAKKEFVPLDLSRVFNAPLAGPGFPSGPGDLSALSPGKKACAGAPFSIGKRQKGMVVLESKWVREPGFPSETGRIPVSGRFDSIALLVATDRAHPHTWGHWKNAFLALRGHGKDGSTWKMPLYYGYHAGPWNLYHGIDRSTVAHVHGGKQAFRAERGEKRHVTLFCVEIENPKPNVALQAISFEGPAWGTLLRAFLFAATGVRKA